MPLSRPTPQQVATDLPLDAAREAVWQSFIEAGVKTPVIDREKNIVFGTTGDGFLSATRTVTATFAAQSAGTLISVENKPVIGGSIDFGLSKRRAKKIADTIERVIARGWTRAPSAAETSPAIAPVAAAPIAEPRASQIAAPLSGPVYATALPARQGNTIMLYAILGLTCVPIAAPFALVYANKALKTYGELDPGDKSLVNICRIIGIVGCVLLVARIVFQVWFFSRTK